MLPAPRGITDGPQRILLPREPTRACVPTRTPSVCRRPPVVSVMNGSTETDTRSVTAVGVTLANTEGVMNFVALRMLNGDRAKYFSLIFAIAVCTFLVENQTSIFAGVMKRTASQILDVTDAEVWVMDPATEYWEQTKPLKDTDLMRVRSVPGVQWAVRLFKGTPVARTSAGRFATAFVLGLDDITLAGAPRQMFLGSWDRLREPETIVIDKAGYVQLFPSEPFELGRKLEMNDHQVTIVGISDASPPHVSLPVIHARYSEAVDFLGRERTQLSFVLVRPESDIGPQRLAARIAGQTGLRARTTSEFMWDCIWYYTVNTAIPVNFGITISVAILVGMVVAGQTFYLFTFENLRQFGALKAMGVTNLRLVWMVLLQAFTTGSLGFAFGTGLAAAFFEIIGRELAMRGMTLMWQSVGVAAVAIVMVVAIASLVSVRRVLVLEPASVFRA
jgi:putative ABC transport system permease protein